MRYKIGRNPVYRAPIPALIGGINTAASSDVVGDNQLSNCLNMMAMDGILRTRPAFVVDKDKGTSALQSNAKNIKKYDFTVEQDGVYGKMISVWGTDGVITFFHCRKDGSLLDAGSIDTKGNIINEFTITGNDGLYCFVTVDVAAEGQTQPIRKYDIYNFSQTEGSPEWKVLSADDIYAPVVATNCLTNGGLAPKFSGDFILGYNLLGTKYKVEYTAFNEMLVEQTHSAVYALPISPPEGTTVRVEIMNDKGEVTEHSVKIENSSEWNIEKEPPDDGLCISVMYDRVAIRKTEYDDNNKPIGGIGYVTGFEEKKNEGAMYLPDRNNITITAEYEPDEEAKKRIFSATCAAWYGGNQGLASGTRLFIGGMEGVYKNVLQWTDLSNPLYFPENCNAEVGDPSQGITAFGKQADMLVVFKPFEIYGASYLLQDAPVEDAAYDFISDLTVTMAVFPLTQISAEIGCDCPGSIQLCRNRLCWAHSNGKVYTLVSSSQYNEKNIYELSDPIRRAIPTLGADVLKNATSTDWEGYYVLSAGEHIFLMQYESYGYSRIYSYTSEEAASHKLPWFYLKTPFVPMAVMNIDNRLIAVSNPDNSAIVLHRADGDSVKDDIVILDGGSITVSPSQIPSMVQSKVFDFSRPEIKKVICHILAEVGGTDGNSIKLSAVTDRSRYEDTVEGDGNSPINQDDEFTLEGGSVLTPMPEAIERTIMRIDGNSAVPVDIKRIKASAPGFFRMVRVNPGIFGVRKFAVRLESEGAFSLGQVCIEYKMLGSVN